MPLHPGPEGSGRQVRDTANPRSISDSQRDSERGHPSGGLRGVLRDFTAALGQQMYFWGRDVVHPDGNLLQAHGFDRRPSEGLDGSSCYELPRSAETVELHGACVGLYQSQADGFLFVRSRKRCFLYASSKAPVPGTYPETLLRTHPEEDLMLASQRFLSWWLEYETWIRSVTAPGYRDACFRTFKKLPRSTPWLAPAAGLEWLHGYAADPHTLDRSRTRKRTDASATS